MKRIPILFFLIFSTTLSFGQDLKITEIMYNPSGGDNPWEWIEIYNSGSKIIDLSGYVIDDASGTQLSESNILTGSISPNASVILFDADDISEEQFQEVWGNVNVVGVNKWPTLGNTGDAIGIWDSFESYDGDQKNQLNTAEKLAYKNTVEGWPNDDGKASIYLIGLDLDNELGASWLLSFDGGETPINTAYLSLELHENSGTDVGSPGIKGGVVDAEQPIILCPEDVVIAIDSDSCTTNFPLLMPTATDNSEGKLTIEGVRSDELDLLLPFSVGETTITWTAIDEAGNISEPCVQTITVNDDQDPVIECPDDIDVSSADGIEVLIEISNAAATDTCEGSLEVSALRSDGEELQSPYPLGETTIVWKAADASGNTAECTQTVVVTFIPATENTITSLTIDGQIGETQIDEESRNILLIMPIGTDLTALIPIIEIAESAMISPEIGTPLDFTVPQTYIVTAQSGAAKEWVVEVKLEADTVAPTFAVNGNTSDFTTTLEVGEAYVLGSITNIEDKSPITTKITGEEFVDSSQAGASFAVTYEVSDGTNNTTIIETVLINEIVVEEFQVVSFTLINADTDEDLFTIEEGMQIDINSLPTMRLDIRANTTADVESVRFSLEGALSTSRTESLLPYALFQDLPIGDYMGSDFIIGAYTVKAIPYSEDSLRGDMGTAFAVSFELVNSCQDFELELEVITDILTCGGTSGSAIVSVKGGVAPITYVWNHDQELNSEMATNLSAGEYTVTATDANNCSTELTLAFTDPELPEVSLLPFESVLDTQEPIVLFEGEPFGGSYSGVGVSEGEFDPSIGKGVYDITYTYTNETTGCENSVTGEIEVLSSEVLSVESFTLVNADTNEDLFELQEGMVIDITSLPTLRLDIRANTSVTTESVKLSLTGTQTSSRTESLTPYALFQDLPIGDYKGNDFVVGAYAVSAVPYALDGAKGDSGATFQINFELVDTNLSVTDFMLVNADTNEDLFLIEEGMQIDINLLPTIHLDIRAITTDDVESVRLSLAGALETERTESLVPYALFQDLPIGDYKGSDFVLGAYAVRAVPYSRNSLQGEKGTSLTINFELVDGELSGKQINNLIISPNPANVETSLSFDRPVALQTIMVYDNHGRLVRTIDGNQAKIDEAYTIEIKALQSGNYFIKSIDKNGFIYTGQLLVKKK